MSYLAFFSRTVPLLIVVVLVSVFLGFLAIINHFAITFLILLAVLFTFAIFFKYLSPSPIYLKLIFIVLLGSLVFGHGFSNATLHIGPVKIPFGEFVVLLSAIIFLIKVPISFVLKVPEMVLLLFIFLFPLLLHLPFNVSEYGIVALRDATHYIDMVMFFVGFSVAYLSIQNKVLLEKVWPRFFLIIIVLSSIYIVTYPFGHYIYSFSPKLMGYQQLLPIFGHYSMVNITALTVLLMFMVGMKYEIWKGNKLHSIIIVAFSFMIILGLLLMQTRAIMVAVFFIMFVLSFMGFFKHVLWSLLFMFFVLLIMQLLSYYDLSIEGRHSAISLETIYNMFLSISGSGELQSAADGTGLRLGWWATIVDNSLNSFYQFMFGQGFGLPLTDFKAPGTDGHVLVREPHNSYLSVYARSGFFVLVLWLVFKLRIYMILWRLSKVEKNICLKNGFFLVMLIFVFSNDVRALVEPVFEMPYSALPFYFFAGFSVYFYYHDRLSMSSEGKS